MGVVGGRVKGGGCVRVFWSRLQLRERERERERIKRITNIIHYDTLNSIVLKRGRNNLICRLHFKDNIKDSE